MFYVFSDTVGSISGSGMGRNDRSRSEKHVFSGKRNGMTVVAHKNLGVFGRAARVRSPFLYTRSYTSGLILHITRPE